MFFTECARLAERHPDLASAVQRVDAQLAKMRTDGVIRLADFASFLEIDPNQVNAVLEKLAQAKLLLAEEMVECGYCGMAVLHSEYREDMEDEGDYRCTSCDRPLTENLIRPITTYRSGKEWQDVSALRNGTVDAGLRAASTPDEQGWYTHVRLAEVFDVPKEALRKRLDRFRDRTVDGWKVNEDRRSTEAGYLYSLKYVRSIIEELRASSKRPAK